MEICERQQDCDRKIDKLLENDRIRDSVITNEFGFAQKLRVYPNGAFTNATRHDAIVRDLLKSLPRGKANSAVDDERNFHAKHRPLLINAILSLTRHGGVFGVEWNPNSVPDRYLHPLQGRTEFNEAPARRTKLLPKEAIAKQVIDFEFNDQRIEIPLCRAKLASSSGSVEHRENLLFKMIPRHFVDEEGQTHSYMERRLHMIQRELETTTIEGVSPSHIVPAEEERLRDLEVEGRPVMLHGTRVKFWDVRYIVPFVVLPNRDFIMFGLGFHPESGELLSIRPCKRSPMMTWLAVPSFFPMIENLN